MTFYVFYIVRLYSGYIVMSSKEPIFFYLPIYADMCMGFDKKKRPFLSHIC